MIPQRRFSALLGQARAYQRQKCVYHNSPLDSSNFSLYSDHRCDKSEFPRITTTILEVHTDEVWNIEWSHDGAYLASASKDKTAIIWRRGVCAPSNIMRKIIYILIVIPVFPRFKHYARLVCSSYFTRTSLSCRMCGLVTG